MVNDISLPNKVLDKLFRAAYAAVTFATVAFECWLVAHFRLKKKNLFIVN